MTEGHCLGFRFRSQPWERVLPAAAETYDFFRISGPTRSGGSGYSETRTALLVTRYSCKSRIEDMVVGVPGRLAL